MPSNISVSKLAKELDMTEQSVLELCHTLGVPVRSTRSSLDEAYADMVRRRAERDGLIGEGWVESPSSPATGTRKSPSRGRRVNGRRLKVLHLQKMMSINGREALGSREFLTHLRTESHSTTVRALVLEPMSTDERFLGDFLTPEQFRADPPDVVTCESSLLAFGLDQLRIEEKLLAEYLRHGGVVIVDGHGIQNTGTGQDGEPSSPNLTAWAALAEIAPVSFLDGLSPDHVGVHLRNNGEGLAQHPQIAAYEPRFSAHSDWLSPAYHNVESVLVLDPRPVFPAGDLLGAITEAAFPLDLTRDLKPDLVGPFHWGVVRQVGAGFLVLIAGSVMEDAVVSRNPDNAIFLQQLAELLVGEAEREKGLRGIVAEPPRPTPQNGGDSVVLRSLIEQGEGRQIEFKASARHDLRTGEKNRELENEIAKQVAAMWNSDGGDILVGVRDDGSLIGIEVDFPHVHGNNEDGWIRFIEDLLIDRVGEAVHAANPVRITTQKLDGLTIGRLSVPRGERAAYYLAPAENRGAKRDNRFLVRANNSIRELDPRELVQFISDRFA